MSLGLPHFLAGRFAAYRFAAYRGWRTGEASLGALARRSPSRIRSQWRTHGEPMANRRTDHACTTTTSLPREQKKVLTAGVQRDHRSKNQHAATTRHPMTRADAPNRPADQASD